MEVDNCYENQLHACPREFVKPMSLAVDDRASGSHPRSSGLRVSTKSKAPSPPGLKDLDSPGFSQWYPGNQHFPMDQKEQLIDKDLSLVVVLPGGAEKTTTVHGSKPLMDLLVTLCAQYHLNPSNHTLELVTANRNNIKLKPNALIGTLDAERILLKPKGEDKNRKTSSHMPEATVRMVINYRKTQKTILRVNPRVPLSELLPAICEKCEFDTESTVLLRDVQSLAPLDLSSSLNDYAIREVYARDTNAPPSSPVSPTSPVHAVTIIPGKDKNQKEKENKGLFSKFRRSKKNSQRATTVSAPSSPVLVSKPRPLSMALPSTDLPPLSSPTSPTDTPKKRRAPQPPVVVSQGCRSDITTRRRFYSEPNSRLDGDQMGSLSLGSSAESSLKRTKRKAPPPPTSPSAVIQDSVFGEENAAVAATNTLEEIREQEEMTPSVVPAPANDTQGEDGTVSTSSNTVAASPTPPSLDTEMLCTVSAETIEEDQSADLSSDGKYELFEKQSNMNDPAAISVERIPADAASSEPEDRSGGLCQVENVNHESSASASGSVEVDCGSLASTVSQPEKPETELQASVQGNTETLREQTDRLENPVAMSTSRPTGEDAEVQTDFTLLPPPPPPPPQQVPLDSPGKKDMSTFTEEPDLEKCTTALISETSSSPCPDSTQSGPAASKSPTIYASDSEPKPKPSNELTREYIPKVGMTTYTIVPQKSLEKLRYFEVALTLETPPAASNEGLDISSIQLDESVASSELRPESKEKGELQPTVPGEDVLTSTTTTQTTVNGSLSGSTHSSPLASPLKAEDKIPPLVNAASQTDSEKIPPAIKPKPGSFRLSQPKKTGYYVTSAAEKGMSAGPVPQGSPVSAMLPSPPLSPSAQCQKKMSSATNVQWSPEGEDRNKTTLQMTRHGSLQRKGPRAGLSLEKLRTFGCPRPYSPATPSRFAQAVSSAVKRSQTVSYGERSPCSPPFSPTTIHSPTKGLSMLRDDGNEAESDKSPTLERAEGEAPSFTDVNIDGETSL